MDGNRIRTRRAANPLRAPRRAPSVSGAPRRAGRELAAPGPGGLLNPLEAPADGHGIIPEPALLIGPVVRIRLLVHERRHGFESGVAPIPDRVCGPRHGRAFQRHSLPQAPRCFGDRPRHDSTPRREDNLSLLQWDSDAQGEVSELCARDTFRAHLAGLARKGRKERKRMRQPASRPTRGPRDAGLEGRWNPRAGLELPEHARR